MEAVYVLDAVRTPVGRHGGGLSGVRPDDLAAHVVGSLAQRTPGDDVFFGAANGSGEDNRDVARMAVLLAGLPTSVPGVTVNRLCGSGMEAVVQASRAIVCGDTSVTIAGGVVESMSRAPWVLAKPERAFERADRTLHDTTLGWRMRNPRLPEQWTVSLGEGAEILADEYAISREAQDEFALASHRNAHAAWERGAFDDEVAAVPESELIRDEGIRPDSSLEALAKLRPVFRDGGSVTAGNSSPLSDGAAALLLADEAGVEASGRDPLARIVARGLHAVEPQRYGIGPVEAATQALERAGSGWDDIELVELNDAFAAQSLACLADWPELDPAKLNPNGGAIALGHPIGCSGARIVTSAAHELRRRGPGRRAIATMCIGVGQGIALVLES